MTGVRFRLRRPDGFSEIGALVKAGSINLTPTRRHGTDDGEVLPLPAQVVLRGRAEVAHLEPSGLTWCWAIEEVIPSLPNRIRFVNVPDSGSTIDYEDLPDVDPATLLPTTPDTYDAVLLALADIRASAIAAAGIGPAYNDPQLSFLRSMCDPLVQPTGSGKIKLDRIYPTEYTGPVSGSFEPPAGHPTAAGTYITVGDPGDLLPTFRGTVYGQVTGLSSLATYRVQACKATDALYPMGTPGACDASGFFAIDLSGVGTYQKGEWRLRLEKTSIPGVAVGGIWPSGSVYTDLTVSLHAISDADSLLATVAAPTAGTYQFLSSAPGSKRLTLQTTGGALLADDQPITGNLRSYVVSAGQPGYGTRFPEQCYVYDQAVALLAAIAAADRDLARLLIRGLARLQTTSGAQAGGFRFSGRQSSANYGDPAYRTGAHAFAVHAALAYAQAYPEDTASRAAEIAVAGINWAAGYLASSGNRQGLYLGGLGAYTPDGGGGQTFAELFPLTWASTEHNIDMYFVLRMAGKVLGGTYNAQATTLAGVMMAKLWNADQHRLNQGLQTTGPDTADPLDVHSWGSIFLADAGYLDRAVETMSSVQLAPFQFTRTAPNGNTVTGYATAYASAGYPSMIPHVWWEGTFSTIYAMRKLGQDTRANAATKLAKPAQFGDGSYPYVSDYDPTYELVPYRSVASTGWGVLAAIGAGAFDTGAVLNSRN